MTGSLEYKALYLWLINLECIRYFWDRDLLDISSFQCIYSGVRQLVDFFPNCVDLKNRCDIVMSVDVQIWQFKRMNMKTTFLLYNNLIGCFYFYCRHWLRIVILNSMNYARGHKCWHHRWGMSVWGALNTSTFYLKK